MSKSPGPTDIPANGPHLQRISSTDLQAFDRLEQALDFALDLADVVKVHGAVETYRVACLKAGIDAKVFRDFIKEVKASVNTGKPAELTA